MTRPRISLYYTQKKFIKLHKTHRDEMRIRMLYQKVSSRYYSAEFMQNSDNRRYLLLAGDCR